MVLGFNSLVLNADEKPRIDAWLIDTRCAPVSGDWERGKERIRYWRLGENREWSGATAASFAESGERSAPAVFLLHGNRTSNDEAVEFAWPIYCWLRRQTEVRSFRVVVWSWPSMRTNKRQRSDVQTKACYCDSQSYYLADCLRGMKPETPVCLIGYSFGARIITGGLHLLGGGTLAGRRLPEAAASDAIPQRSGPIRAVLVAPAMDCFALAPGQANGLATAQVEEMLVTQNGCDRALRWYPLLYGRGGPQALGFVGPCRGTPENMRLFHAACCVGKSHHWEDYIECPSLFNVLPHYMFAEAK
ncbi:MAG: hypothetical protein IT426_02900 [Pirellulales bacterium]|nr:hypothetical protein [Pirellulales bacterium]